MEYTKDEMSCRERACLNWMAHIPGVGKKTAGKLLKIFETAENVYDASVSEWGRVLPERLCSMLGRKRETEDAAGEYRKLKEKNMEITSGHLPDYPQRLREIPDPPVFLYYKGGMPQERIPSVAVIGARECSAYGKYTAQLFSETLAEAGVQIISGLASGIDGIGQAAACRRGGRCYAVLGCGADICYPASNRQLYDAVLKGQGGILSEYIPGTQPAPGLFPPRNRIISGLADLILVVEAREKSGTMITVDMALEQGKEVYAIPGRITDSFQTGCHRLIRQGAGMATAPEDILEALGISGKFPDSSSVKKQELSEKEKKIWDILDADPKSLEEIWNEIRNSTGTIANIQEVMYLIVLLCSKGMAEQQGTAYRKSIF